QSQEIIVIAGSTAPVMMVIDDWISAPDQKIWTSSFMSRGKWVIESNATLTGANLEWAVNLLCERSENPLSCSQRTFNELDRLLEGIQPGSNDTYVAVGPNVMDCRQMTDIKQARMIFPQPALPQTISLNAAYFIHAVLENIAYAVRGNVEQLEAYQPSTAIKTIGGMSRFNLWPQLLANVLNRPVSAPVQSEGSLLGAAICAAKGAGLYPSIEEALRAMVKWRDTFQPDEHAKVYNGYYSRWSKIWMEGD
ncbi:MAG: FGGY-family carbohydrate kinase, partial [Promethearchaeota archaeon]